MKKRPDLSPEYIKSLFIYDDGRLFWKERSTVSNSWNGRFADTEAGNSSHGKFGLRCKVVIDKKKYYRAAIVWLIHNNEWPLGELDHKNTNSNDDRIENLRLTTSQGNKANRKINRNNSSGRKGVCLYKGKYLAQIGVNNKCINLGTFPDIESASDAYKKASIKHFGEFARFE